MVRKRMIEKRPISQYKLKECSPDSEMIKSFDFDFYTCKSSEEEEHLCEEVKKKLTKEALTFLRLFNKFSCYGGDNLYVINDVASDTLFFYWTGYGEFAVSLIQYREDYTPEIASGFINIPDRIMLPVEKIIS